MMKAIKALSIDGARVVDLCKRCDELVAEGVSKMYTKGKIAKGASAMTLGWLSLIKGHFI